MDEAANDSSKSYFSDSLILMKYVKYLL